MSTNRELDSAAAAVVEASVRFASLVKAEAPLSAHQVLAAAHTAASFQTTSRACGNMSYLATLIEELER